MEENARSKFAGLVFVMAMLLYPGPRTISPASSNETLSEYRTNYRKYVSLLEQDIKFPEVKRITDILKEQQIKLENRNEKDDAERIIIRGNSNFLHSQEETSETSSRETLEITIDFSTSQKSSSLLEELRSLESMNDPLEREKARLLLIERLLREKCHPELAAQLLKLTEKNTGMLLSSETDSSRKKYLNFILFKARLIEQAFLKKTGQAKKEIMNIVDFIRGPYRRMKITPADILSLVKTAFQPLHEIFTPPPSSGPEKRFSHPGAFHSTREIELARRNIERGGIAAVAASQLLEEARRSLEIVPDPIEVFDMPAYYSNREEAEKNKKRLDRDALAAYCCALAFWLGPDNSKEKYALKCVEILDAWARVNRKVSGADGDLVMCYSGILFIHSAELVYNFSGWSTSSRENFFRWVNNVFRKSAGRIKDRPNNWGAWGLFASMAASYLVDDYKTLSRDINKLDSHMKEAIDERGELPHENRRTSSGMWYTYFALAPLAGASIIAARIEKGSSIESASERFRLLEKALDRFFLYCLKPDSWPYRKPEGLAGRIWQKLYPCDDRLLIPSKNDWPGNLYEALVHLYGKKEWNDWLESARPIRGNRVFIYPSLLYPGF